jgi:hypothetical protein
MSLSACLKSRRFSTIAYAYDAAFLQNAPEGEFRAEENDFVSIRSQNLHEQRTCEG